jgi:hypothetical protein
MNGGNDKVLLLLLLLDVITCNEERVVLCKEDLNIRCLMLCWSLERDDIWDDVFIIMRLVI